MDRLRQHRGEGVVAPHIQAGQAEEDVPGQAAAHQAGHHHVQHGRLLPAVRDVRQGVGAGSHLRTGLNVYFFKLFYFF